MSESQTSAENMKTKVVQHVPSFLVPSACLTFRHFYLILENFYSSAVGVRIALFHKPESTFTILWELTS